MDKVRTRIYLSRVVDNWLKATALFLGNYSRDELADAILAEWLKKHNTVAIDGDTIKLAERPNLEIDGDDVRLVRVDLEGGEKL